MSDRASETGERGEIAIVGIALRFPGASSPEALWANLIAGVESIEDLSEERLRVAGVPQQLLDNPHYVRRKPLLADIERFDAGLFGMSPREAQLCGPQQRLLFETAWEALESAGIGAETGGARGGVFVATDMSRYLLRNLLPTLRSDTAETVPETLIEQALFGNDKDHAALRIAHKLDLTGPAFAIGSTCSASLLAAHQAAQSLMLCECDFAIAGGATIEVPHVCGYLYRDSGFASPDGHCRAFDARAAGTVFGSGVGLVVLMRRDDAVAGGHPIYAVIRGSAVNNDGADKQSYTAPSVNGQAQVIHEALAVAAVEPGDIGAIEAHGTGTPLGDPVEIAALHQAFAGKGRGPGTCAIGSIKTNLGHLGSTAGIAGLIKAALMIHHGEIPPSSYFEAPNPKLDFDRGPFFVNTRLLPWPDTGGPRLCGVSSFGIGGTNVHAILQSTPQPAPGAAGAGSPHLLVWSAATSSALAEQLARLRLYLAEHARVDLADVAWTLQVGRRHLRYRDALLCDDLVDALRLLGDEDARRRTVAENQRAQRWLKGEAIDWAAESEVGQRHHLRLPTYPFERQRYWVDPPTPGQSMATVVAAPAKEAELQTIIEAAVLSILGFTPEQLSRSADLVDLGLDSFLAAELIQILHERLGIHLPVAVLYEHRSVSALAGHLARHLPELEKTEARGPEITFHEASDPASLERFHAGLKHLSPTELGTLEPLLAAGGEAISLTELEQRWRDRNIFVFYATGEGDDALAAVYLLDQRPAMHCVSAAGLERRDDLLISYTLIAAPFRGHLNVERFGAWLAKNARLRRELRTRQVASTLRFGTAVCHKHGRILAATLARSPHEEQHLFDQIYFQNFDPTEHLERLLTDQRLQKRLLAAISAQEYEGISGADLLQLSAEPTAAVFAVLRRLIPEDMRAALLDTRRRVERGDLRFAGFELRWLEPLFLWRGDNEA